MQRLHLDLTMASRVENDSYGRRIVRHLVRLLRIMPKELTRKGCPQYVDFGHLRLLAGASRVRAVTACAQQPTGRFCKKTAGREWDTRKAELEMTRAAWAGAVASRDRTEQEAMTADNATFQNRLDAIRKEHAAKAAAAIARCAPIKERLQDFTIEHKRIERATATLSQDKQKELGLARGRGHSISR